MWTSRALPPGPLSYGQVFYMLSRADVCSAPALRTTLRGDGLAAVGFLASVEPAAGSSGGYS